MIYLKKSNGYRELEFIKKVYVVVDQARALTTCQKILSMCLAIPTELQVKELTFLCRIFSCFTTEMHLIHH